MVGIEEAKHRWRTYTKKLLIDSALNAFCAGEVWGEYEWQGGTYTAVVSPCGWYIICYGYTANGQIYGFFPEDTKLPIDMEKWKNINREKK